MRTLIAACFALIALCWGATLASAQTTHTPDQAKALVEKGVAFWASAGKDAAVAAFADPAGGWTDGDLYLVVHADDDKLTMISHPNKALIGKPQVDQKDAEGRLFNQEMKAAVAKSGEAWISYKWPNPATKKIAPKKSYFKKVGDVIIAAGVYE